MQVPVESDLLQKLADHRRDDLGDDEADQQDDEEAEQVGQEAEEPVGGSLETVSDVHDDPCLVDEYAKGLPTTQNPYTL